MGREKLCEKVLEVRMVNDRAKTVIVVIEEDGLRLNCGHAPQSGRSLKEKQSFYDEPIGEWDIHSTGDLVMCMVDLMDTLVGILIDLMGLWRAWHRSEEFRRKNVISFTLAEIICVKYMA